MKRSSSGQFALMEQLHDWRMETPRRPAEDLLEIARVLLLLQGSILVVTTIEALIWGVAFAGAPGVTVFMSGAAAAVILVGRARLRADRRWAQKLVYIVEGVILATLVIDAALAVALTGALPPAVALLTRVVLPMTVILLLRRSAQATAAPISRITVAAVEGVS